MENPSNADGKAGHTPRPPENRTNNIDWGLLSISDIIPQTEHLQSLVEGPFSAQYTRQQAEAETTFDFGLLQEDCIVQLPAVENDVPASPPSSTNTSSIGSASSQERFYGILQERIHALMHVVAKDVQSHCSTFEDVFQHRANQLRKAFATSLMVKTVREPKEAVLATTPNVARMGSHADPMAMPTVDKPGHVYLPALLAACHTYLLSDEASCQSLLHQINTFLEESKKDKGESIDGKTVQLLCNLFQTIGVKYPKLKESSFLCQILCCLRAPTILPLLKAILANNASILGWCSAEDKKKNEKEEIKTSSSSSCCREMVLDWQKYVDFEARFPANEMSSFHEVEAMEDRFCSIANILSVPVPNPNGSNTNPSPKVEVVCHLSQGKLLLGIPSQKCIHQYLPHGLLKTRLTYQNKWSLTDEFDEFFVVPSSCSQGSTITIGITHAVKAFTSFPYCLNITVQIAPSVETLSKKVTATTTTMTSSVEHTSSWKLSCLLTDPRKLYGYCRKCVQLAMSQDALIVLITADHQNWEVGSARVLQIPIALLLERHSVPSSTPQKLTLAIDDSNLHSFPLRRMIEPTGKLFLFAKTSSISSELPIKITEESSTAFTVEMWVMPCNVDEQRNLFVQGNRDTEEYFLEISSTPTGSICWSGGQRTPQCGTTAVTYEMISKHEVLKRWHHVALVMTGKFWHLYINGKHMASTEAQPPKMIPQRSRKYTIGKTFVGLLTEFRIWKYSRSAQWTQRDMCTRLSGSEPCLAVYFPLQEGYGSFVCNLSNTSGPVHSVIDGFSDGAWVRSDELPIYGSRATAGHLSVPEFMTIFYLRNMISGSKFRGPIAVGDHKIAVMVQVGSDEAKYLVLEYEMTTGILLRQTTVTVPSTDIEMLGLGYDHATRGLVAIGRKNGVETRITFFDIRKLPRTQIGIPDDASMIKMIDQNQEPRSNEELVRGLPFPDFIVLVFQYVSWYAHRMLTRSDPPTAFPFLYPHVGAEDAAGEFLSILKHILVLLHQLMGPSSTSSSDEKDPFSSLFTLVLVSLDYCDSFGVKLHGFLNHSTIFKFCKNPPEASDLILSSSTSDAAVVAEGLIQVAFFELSHNPQSPQGIELLRKAMPFLMDWSHLLDLLKSLGATSRQSSDVGLITHRLIVSHFSEHRHAFEFLQQATEVDCKSLFSILLSEIASEVILQEGNAERPFPLSEKQEYLLATQVMQEVTFAFAICGPMSPSATSEQSGAKIQGKEASAFVWTGRANSTAVFSPEGEVISPTMPDISSEKLEAIITTYALKLMGYCIKTVTQWLSAVRSQKTSYREMSAILQKGFFALLLPSFMIAVPLLGPRISTAIMEQVYKFREILMNLISYRPSHVTYHANSNTKGAENGNSSNETWDLELLDAVSFTVCRVCSNFVAQTPSADVELSGNPYEALFKGGFQKVGTARDAAIKSLLQGVGTISKVFDELQQKTGPKQLGFIPGSPLGALERQLTACFCSMLTPTTELLQPTISNLEPYFTFAVRMRSNILSKRQADSSFVDLLLQRANFLCKFETVSLQALPKAIDSLPKKNKKDPQDSSKQWKRMFVAWKAMKQLKTLMNLSHGDQRGGQQDGVSGADDLPALIGKFLQVNDVQAEAVTNALQKRMVKAQQRLFGMKLLRDFLVETRLQRTALQHHYVHAMIAKVTAGHHYLADLTGAGTEVVGRVQSAYRQLFEECIKAVHTATSQEFKYWAELLIAMCAIPWQPSDYAMLSDLNVPQQLIGLCSFIDSKFVWNASSNSTNSTPPTQPHHLRGAIRNDSLRMNHNLSHRFTSSVLSICSPCIGITKSGLALSWKSGRGSCLSSEVWPTRASSGFCYYEVTIVEAAASSSIYIGLAPAEYNLARMPGWEAQSCSYQSDGILYHENRSGKQVGTPFQQSCTVGCGMNLSTHEVFWTRNGKRISVLLPQFVVPSCQPCIGLEGKSLVSVNFGASPFQYYLPDMFGTIARPKYTLREKAWDSFRGLFLQVASYLRQISYNTNGTVNSKSQSLPGVIPVVTQAQRLLLQHIRQIANEVERTVLYRGLSIPTSNLSSALCGSPEIHVSNVLTALSRTLQALAVPFSSFMDVSSSKDTTSAISVTDDPNTSSLPKLEVEQEFVILLINILLRPDYSQCQVDVLRTLYQLCFFLEPTMMNKAVQAALSKKSVQTARPCTLIRIFLLFAEKISPFPLTMDNDVGKEVVIPVGANANCESSWVALRILRSLQFESVSSAWQLEITGEMLQMLLQKDGEQNGGAVTANKAFVFTIMDGLPYRLQSGDPVALRQEAMTLIGSADSGTLLSMLKHDGVASVIAGRQLQAVNVNRLQGKMESVRPLQLEEHHRSLIQDMIESSIASFRRVAATRAFGDRCLVARILRSLLSFLQGQHGLEELFLSESTLLLDIIRLTSAFESNESSETEMDEKQITLLESLAAVPMKHRPDQTTLAFQTTTSISDAQNTSGNSVTPEDRKHSPDARIRMAEDLAVHGYSIDMSLIALEETRFDRAAALRLLSQHHDDFLVAMREARNTEQEDERPEGEGAEVDADGDAHSELPDGDGERSEGDEFPDGNGEEQDGYLRGAQGSRRSESSGPLDEGDMLEENAEDEELEEEEDPPSPRSIEQNSQPRNESSSYQGLAFSGGYLKFALEPLGPQFTIDFRIRLRSALFQTQTVLCITPSDNGGIVFKIFNGKLCVGTIMETAFVCCCEMELDATSTDWLHVTGVQDCAQFSLYRNGLMIASGYSPGVTETLSSEWFFGTSFDGSEPFLGDLRDLSIFPVVIKSPDPDALIACHSSLVLRLRCDEGEFPLLNSAPTKPDGTPSGPRTVTVMGGVEWITRSTVWLDEWFISPELDHSHAIDSPNIFEITATQDVFDRNQYLRKVAAFSNEELFASLSMVETQVLVHNATKLSLELLSVMKKKSYPLQTTDSLIKHLSVLFRRILQSDPIEAVKHIDKCHEALQVIFENCSQKEMLLEQMIRELLHFITLSRSSTVFESAHPCKPVVESPREVQFPGARYYDVFFDQRTSAPSTIVTFYADHTLTQVIARTRSTGLSPFRLRTHRFFFDVRIEGTTPQWGYKMTVQSGAEREKLAVELLQTIFRLGDSFSPETASFIRRKVTFSRLLQSAAASVGVTRRSLFRIATQLLRKPSAFPDFQSIDLSPISELKRLFEKQYRREVTARINSRFVQVMTEFFLVARDTEIIWKAQLETQQNKTDDFEEEEDLEEKLDVKKEPILQETNTATTTTTTQVQVPSVPIVRKTDDSIPVSQLDAAAEFRSQRQRIKQTYHAMHKTSKETVELEKLHSPETLRIEANSDRSFVAWSDYLGGTFVADVTLYRGRWYYEARVASTGDITVAIMTDSYNRARGLCEPTAGSWGCNGRKNLIYTPTGTCPRSSKCRAWRTKDVVGIALDIDKKVMRLFLNGTETGDVISLISDSEQFMIDRAAAADYILQESQRQGSVFLEPQPSSSNNTVGFTPAFILGSEEGLAVNFGGAHFEHEPPSGFLPIDPSNLSIGTLVPFNCLRAFVDVTHSVVHNAILPPFFLEEENPFENDPSRQGPPHTSLIAGDSCSSNSLNISLLEVRNTGRYLASVFANCVLFSGKWYYEVTLSTQGLMQVGWASMQHVPDAEKGIGVGDTEHSWGIDLFRRLKWYADRAQPLGSTRRWAIGDVIGCAVDLDAGTMMFSLNGKCLSDITGSEMLFKGIHTPEGIRPSVSFRAENSCVFNFGASPVKYLPNGYRVLGIPDTWLERIDTYYSGMATIAVEKRLKNVLPSSVPNHVYVQIIQATDQICRSEKKNIHQVDAEQLRRNNATLSEMKIDELKHQFFVLKQLNKLFEIAVPMSFFPSLRKNERAQQQFEDSHPAGGLSDWVLVAKKFAFGATRDTLIKGMLKETNAKGEHARLTVNRLLASNNKNSTHSDGLKYSVFAQTHSLLVTQHPRLFKSVSRFWSVVFAGEGAEDVGGPFREHISAMCAELMSDYLPLFIPTPNNLHNTGEYRECFVPASCMKSELHQAMYRFVGRLLGGALRSAEPLSLFFPPLVWKYLVGEKLQEDDLGTVDQLCLQCVLQMREMALHQSAEEIFDDTFSTEMFTTQLSDGTSIDLMPNGSKIAVTLQTCRQYADALLKVRIHESTEQLSWIREGLTDVIPEVAIRLMTWPELELRICGKADYQVRELQEMTTFEGISSDDRRVGYLWKALEDATTMQRRLFLKFVSGRERLPVKLRIIPMTVSTDPDFVFPRAATCFFALELPDYSTLEILKQRVYYTIANCMEIDTDFRARDVDETEGPQLIGVEDDRGGDLDDQGISEE